MLRPSQAISGRFGSNTNKDSVCVDSPSSIQNPSAMTVWRSLLLLISCWLWTARSVGGGLPDIRDDTTCSIEESQPLGRIYCTAVAVATSSAPSQPSYLHSTKQYETNQNISNHRSEMILAEVVECRRPHTGGHGVGQAVERCPGVPCSGRLWCQSGPLAPCRNIVAQCCAELFMWCICGALIFVQHISEASISSSGSKGSSF